LVSLFISLCLGFLIVACGKGGPTRLHNSFESPEKLLQRALQALEESDIAGLHALCLSRYEHDSVLVPAMGKDQVDLNLAWFYLQQNIDKGVSYAIHAYEGRKLTVEGIEFLEQDEVCGPLTLHRSPQVTVSEPATGETFVMTCFGTIVEEHGHFKLASIRD
jgi:hypothetical protein